MPNAIAGRTDPLRVAQALGTSLAIAVGAFSPAVMAMVKFPEHVVLISRVPPPEPQFEPESRKKGKTWSPGFWRYDGIGYKWIAGTHVTDRPGQRWQSARWTQVGEHWHFVVGHWEKAG